jgi:hypothetical protein
MRKTNDNYPSEPALVSQLLARCPQISGTVLEPTAGAGRLAEPLKQAGLRVITNDIDKQYNYKTDHNLDATKRELWYTDRYDWVITNPPYESYTLESIMAFALETTKRGVALLLRLSANEPVIKRGLRGNILMAYADKMRYLITFSAPRPSFTSDGKTDSVTTAWFVWDKEFSWKEVGMRSPFQYAVNWRQDV